MDGEYCSIIAAIDDGNGDRRWFSREKENNIVPIVLYHAYVLYMTADLLAFSPSFYFHKLC